MAPLLAWNWILKNLLSSETHRWSLKCTSDEWFNDGVADRSKLHKWIDIPDFICFVMGMLFDDQLYISPFISGAVHLLKNLEIQIQHVSADGVRSCDCFVSIHILREFTRYRQLEKTELLILSFHFMSIGNGKAARLHSDTHAALPPLAWAVKSHFPVFLHWERRKSGSCSFTAAFMGGKTAFSSFPPLWEEESWHFQLYRRSHRR